MLLIDDFVNSPISALRFISLPLRRTASTPRDARFARLDLGLFTKSSIYEFILIVVGRTSLRGTELRSANGISRASQTYFKTDPMARHAARPLL